MISSRSSLFLSLFLALSAQPAFAAKRSIPAVVTCEEDDGDQFINAAIVREPA